MQARCGGHRRRGRTPVRRTGCRTAAATCWLAMRWRAPAAQPPPWAWSTHRGLPRPCSRRRRPAPRPPAPPTAATSASSSVSPRQIRCPSASTRGGQDRFHRGDPRPLPMHLDLVIEVASVSTPARGWPARWAWRCGGGRLAARPAAASSTSTASWGQDQPVVPRHLREHYRGRAVGTPEEAYHFMADKAIG
jgi:hypothetical protein